MSKVSFPTILIFIIFVVVVVMSLMTLNYTDTKKTKSVNKKGLTKTKIRTSKESGVSINTVQTEIENKCHTLEIPSASKNVAYILNGKFKNSCVSLYRNDQRIYSRIFNDDANIVFTSNIHLTSQVFKLSKTKSHLIPIKLNETHKVVFNNAENIQVQSYTVNYDIDLREIVHEFPESVGTNEYDLELYAEKNIDNLETREFPKTTGKNGVFKFTSNGSYAVLYVTGSFNYDLNINSNIYNIRNSNKTPSIQITYIQNPRIEIKNFEAKEIKKDVNREYVEFITSPNTLMNQFVNGKKSSIKDFSNIINDKVLIYRLFD